MARRAPHRNVQLTVGTALTRAARRLAHLGSANVDARRLLEAVTGKSAGALLAARADHLDAATLQRFDALVDRRAAGEPVAYVTGEVGFYGRTFVVTPDVLVPRPESEHLVEAALDDARARARRGPVAICDVGTGSGAIGLTLAAELTSARLVASDASAAALAVARANAERLGLSERVALVEGDLATPLLPLAPFDIIVANLPYVPTADVPQKPDPVGFEPTLAVDGGADGLVLYRRLIPALPRLGSPGASAFLEAAPATIEPLAALIAELLPEAHMEIGEDYAGLDRFINVSLG